MKENRWVGLRAMKLPKELGGVANEREKEPERNIVCLAEGVSSD